MHYQIINNNDGKRAGKVLNFSLHYSRFIACKTQETFQNWQKEILNSFAYNLHNGYIEGINNQTKVIKRNAFGYKRFD